MSAVYAKRVKLTPTADKIKKITLVSTILFVFVFSAYMIDLDLVRFAERLGNAGAVLRMFADFNPAILPEAISEMLVSLALAAASLFVGFWISIALAFLAASNTAPNKIMAVVIKAVVAIIRAVPSLVWLLMIVASIGFGNTAGMVGLLLSTMGYLVKSFAAAIEEKGTDSIEALRAVGAPWLHIVVKGVLPGVVTSFLSWSSIRFEANIAESIGLGMVGVGGIGALLMRAIRGNDFGNIVAILTVIFITLLAVEIFSIVLRREIKKS
ncbi:MAG: ABC transporter permease subunit [Turicibacter sp.]|nr:ABC transporter permease subunit [Turicibacter sp.]